MSRWERWTTKPKQGMSLSGFITEQETPAQMAQRMGLQSDGSGGYIDPNTGEVVARTVNNELVFYDPMGGAISAQSDGAALTQAQPSWRDPVTGELTVPPGQPESPEEMAAIPDAIPALAPPGYSAFMNKKKKDMYAQQGTPEQEEIDDVQQEVDPQLGMQPEMGVQEEGLRYRDVMMREDEEAINKTLPDLITAKRAGKNAPAGANQIMKDNAMEVTGSNDNVTVRTPENWKGTPILGDMLSKQSEVNHKVGRAVKDSRVPGGVDTKPGLDLSNKIKHSLSPEAIKELKTVAKQETTPASSSGRANANFNFGELTIGALLSNPDIQTIEDIKNHKIPLENIHNNEKYLEHLSKQNPAKVIEFINNFKEKTREYGFSPNPEDIWIRSTNQQMGPQSVIDGFKGRDDAATADSADVLFKDRNGEMRGISSKATADAYAGSGGLEKLFNRISKNNNMLDEEGEDFELGKQLIDVRNLMFRTAGLPTNTVESNAMWGKDGYKEHRSKYNDLMRNPDNPFFGRLDELFKEYNPDLIKHFLNHVYPDNLPYELWKFDNDNFKAMDRESINDDEYSLTSIQNPKIGEGDDKAAKRWFALNNKNGPEFAIENRIKSQQPWGSVQYNLVPWNDKKVLRNR